MKTHQNIVAALQLTEDQDSNPVEQANMVHWTYNHRAEIDSAILQQGTLKNLFGRVGKKSY